MQAVQMQIQNNIPCINCRILVRMGYLGQRSVLNSHEHTIW